MEIISKGGFERLAHRLVYEKDVIRILIVETFAWVTIELGLHLRNFLLG